MEAGFSKSDILVLDNPDRAQIEKAIDDIAQALTQRSGDGRRVELAPASLVRVGLTPAQEVQAPDNPLLLFFFSGHGVQVAEKEYMIPRLAGRGDLRGPEDIENSGISVSWLLQRLERAAAASVIILDTHFPRV